MVCISLLLGGLSLIAKYESRIALICVLLGSTSLAFFVVLQWRRLSSPIAVAVSVNKR